MARSQPSTWWSTLHTSPLCSNTGAWHPEENSHSRKHFPWHPRFTQTLLCLLFSPSVFHTLTLTDRDQSHTSYTHLLHSYYLVMCSEAMGERHTALYTESTHAAPCDNPEGSERIPPLHTAMSINLLPNWPVLLSFMIHAFFLRTPALKRFFFPFGKFDLIYLSGPRTLKVYFDGGFIQRNSLWCFGADIPKGHFKLWILHFRWVVAKTERVKSGCIKELSKDDILTQRTDVNPVLRLIWKDVRHRPTFLNKAKWALDGF